MNIEVLPESVSTEICAALLRAKSNDSIEWQGFSIKGELELTGREEDGSVAWHVPWQKNLITDYGRRKWSADCFNNGRIFMSAPQETPRFDRNSILDSTSAASYQASSPAPATDWAAGTKTWAYTFPVPGSTRTIGVVGLADSANSGHGSLYIYTYSLLTPAKTQTTSQTVELNYRLTLSVSV